MLISHKQICRKDYFVALPIHLKYTYTNIIQSMIFVNLNSKLERENYTSPSNSPLEHLPNYRSYFYLQILFK